MDDKKILHKLVRDNTPEIFKQKGIGAKFHEANDEEFEVELLEKLREEVLEFKNAQSMDQLADLLETVDEVIKLKGWTKEAIEDVKVQKLTEKGGYSKRLILEHTE